MAELFRRLSAWLHRLAAPPPDLKAAQAKEREHAERMRRLRIVDLQTDVRARRHPPRAPKEKT